MRRRRRGPQRSRQLARGLHIFAALSPRGADAPTDADRGHPRVRQSTAASGGATGFDPGVIRLGERLAKPARVPSPRACGVRLTAPFLAAMLGVVTPVAVGADADTAAPDDAIQSGEVRSADGVRLAYREAGEGTPTLVLIHGWLCDQSHWDGVLPVLIRRHHVVTLDLAGHGRSGRERTDYTLESFAADVESVVNARSREPLVLVGHSMGGLVALAAAERLQPRVRLIVAVDSLREVMSGPVSEPEIKASEASLKEDFPGYVYRLVRDRMFTPQSDPALAERVAGAMSRADVEVGLSARREAMRANVPRLLSASTVPIVAFEPSSLVPYEQQMPPNLRQPFRVVSIANAGHFIMLERPTEFQAALTSLVDNMK